MRINVSDILVDIQHLTFKRGDRVIYDDMSMQFQRGKVTAIMGPSGIGKTTLLRLIGGQLKPEQGKILINGQDIPQLSRKDLYKEVPPIEIYPDTTVWIKDFAYSYNEPMHNDYFWHQAYGEYPVVGVSWNQAKAFCAWRTLNKNSYIKKKKGRDQVNSFRLPTEAEWEYAARGGLESATYPWGGPYTKSDRGCFLANFKPNRGDYAADQALYTVEAKSYEPNGYNLYNMAGNVSEWTDSSYDPNAYEYVSTMNPNVLDASNKRKVVRGGSWKDVAYFLQVSTRDYEYADSARSYIGFRTVQDYMGVQTTANNTGKIRKR